MVAALGFTILSMNATTWIIVLLYTFIDFVQIYSPSATILFSIYCYTATKNLGRIKWDVSKMIQQKPSDVVHRLNQLKEFYFCNAEFVDQINGCFGFILLLITLCSFIRIVLQISFFIVGFAKSEPWYVYVCALIFLIEPVVDLVIIIFVSEDLNQEVPPTCYISG